MKAIQITSYGGPEVLELVDVPIPTPAAGEVLVRAHAIGAGKPDVLLRTGVYRWKPPLPSVIGTEMSGRIEALGAGVTDLRVGQPVLVYHLKAGCYAEYAAVPTSSVTPLPESVDLDDAVSMPNYQVAWALLNEASRGTNAKTVYVNGAAGGVGSGVIQLCKLAGQTIIAGASTDEKCAFAKQLGATHTINYSREKVPERVLEPTGGRGAELVLGHIIGKSFTDSLAMLAPMGLIVSFNALGGFPEKDLFQEMRANLPRSPAVRCFTMHSYDHDPEGRKRLVDAVIKLFAEGKVIPQIHARLPLADAKKAHALLDARAVHGKLVLKP